MTRERKLRFQYDSGYVHVLKYDPEEGEYILAIVLDPDGEIESSGQHRSGRYVEVSQRQLDEARTWQKEAQRKLRKRTGGIHSQNDPQKRSKWSEEIKQLRKTMRESRELGWSERFQMGTFNINGRFKTYYRIKRITKIAPGKYQVLSTHSPELWIIEGGKSAGGRKTDWFVDHSLIGTIPATSLIDALSVIESV